jgi:hypothetical protein
VGGVCFLHSPVGFPSVRQYFNRESADPLLNHLESPDFAWRTKNSLWDELNLQKKE